jgi:hypothetical protein
MTTVNKAHTVWTLQPNGYADRERTRLSLSLVVSPRAITVNGRLDDLAELADWPAQVQNLDTVSIFVEGQPGITQATLTSRKPSSLLWRTLFAPGTPVQLDGGGEVTDLDQVGSSIAYRPLVQALRGVYTEATARTENTQLKRVLTGLAQWSLARPATSTDSRRISGARAMVRAAPDAVRERVADLLDPTAMTTASLAEAADLLRANGLAEAAEVTPLVGVIRRLRGAAESLNPNTPPPPDGPGRLDHVRTADQADFHQILGLVAAQPVLALALGLRFDLEMPAFTGERAIRVTGALPLLIPGGAPWSKVVADPQSGRFTMAAQPGVAGEVRNGMLDLRPDSDRYVVTTMDVVGTAAQLAGMAASVAGGQLAPATPPPRRNVGFTVAQADRRAGVVALTATRSKTIAAALGEPQGVETVRAAAAPDPNAVATVGPGELVLYADDVTAGYRVDVRVDGGEWRSLMRRTARYSVGDTRAIPPLTADDEGRVDPISLVEQKDAVAGSTVEAGEVIFNWDGWALGARRPGASVAVGPDGTVRTEQVRPQVSPGYPLRMDVAVKGGTLPRLRYGRNYQFRVRTVDLAGNSIDPSLCDPALVSAPVKYRRLDPLPAPELVLRAPLSAGEALTRLVVRSDGDGNPLGGCERHVAPPRAWQNLAEVHGLFDSAMGAATAEQRQRMLALGGNEAGSFTDLMVPDPADPTRKIPAPGLRLAVNADAGHPPTGSLDGLVRGEALPAGEYPVHDTDAMCLPYLADPLATGIAIDGLPTPAGDVVTAKYGGATWPNIQPMRLLAKPGAGPGGVGLASGNAAGRPTLTLTVPPAADLTTKLSSTLTPAGLSLMEVDLPAGTEKAALDGQEPLLTPGKELRIVHAVRRPLLPLEVKTAVADPQRKVGSTVVDVNGTAVCHPASTARVDIEGTWDELIDDGVSEVRTEKRTAITGSVSVDDPAQPNLTWKVRHSLGDGKRRDITYRPVGTTRFREYFAPGTPPEQLVRRVQTGVTTTAINTTRPDPPEIHSVLPTFAWTRTVANGTYTSVRRTAGVRVWLHRPWGQTGTDERLGVLVYRSLFGGTWAAEAERNNLHSMHSRTSRWCGDPLDGWGHTAAHFVPGNFPAHIELDQSLPPVSLKPTANSNPVEVAHDVLGHAVHYEPERDLWYCDIDIDVTDDQMYFPFVWLGLVRHQPRSAPGCHVSSVVVTDPIQLPPRRKLTATALAPDSVKFTVTGPWINNSVFEVSVNARAENPMLGFTGNPSELSVSQPGQNFILASQTVGNTITATGTVQPRVNGVPTTQPLARLVVRELQVGDSLHHGSEGPQTQPTGGANRPVYVDFVDQSQLVH